MRTAASTHTAPTATRALAACLATLAAVAVGWGLGRAAAPEETARPQPRPAQAHPATLTRPEQAAVLAALESDDPRRHALAVSVAAGELGASALADPAILYHHGVDTSAPANSRARRLPSDRYHHR